MTRISTARVSLHRQLVETVIGHFNHWFDIEHILARDHWHLTRRLARKVLAHTVLGCLNYAYGSSWLQFENFLAV